MRMTMIAAALVSAAWMPASAAMAQDAPPPRSRVVVASGVPAAPEVLVLDAEGVIEDALAELDAAPEALAMLEMDADVDIDDEDAGKPRGQRGPLTKKEAEKRWKERFSEFDLNRDGKVTADELVAWQEKKRAERRRKMAERRLERFDANGDGVVTAKEFEEFHAKRFAEADADGDGVITPEERRAALRKRMAELREKMAELRREMGRMRMHMMRRMHDGDRDVEIIIRDDGPGHDDEDHR